MIGVYVLARKGVVDSERSSLQNVEARAKWRENSGSRVTPRGCSVAFVTPTVNLVVTPIGVHL